MRKIIPTILAATLALTACATEPEPAPAPAATTSKPLFKEDFDAKVVAARAHLNDISPRTQFSYEHAEEFITIQCKYKGEGLSDEENVTLLANTYEGWDMDDAREIDGYIDRAFCN